MGKDRRRNFTVSGKVGKCHSHVQNPSTPAWQEGRWSLQTILTLLSRRQPLKKSKGEVGLQNLKRN